MLFHISQARWDALQAQSWHLGDYPATVIQGAVKGTNDYHILDGESGICPVCGIEAESIPVSTPVELEEYKERLKAAA